MIPKNWGNYLLKNMNILGLSNSVQRNKEIFSRYANSTLKLLAWTIWISTRSMMNINSLWGLPSYFPNHFLTVLYRAWYLSSDPTNLIKFMEILSWMKTLNSCMLTILVRRCYKVLSILFQTIPFSTLLLLRIDLNLQKDAIKAW